MSKVLTLNNKMLYRVASDKLVGYDNSIPARTLLLLFDEEWEPADILSDGITFRRVSNHENLWYATSTMTDGTFGHFSSNGSGMKAVLGSGDMSFITDASDMFWGCSITHYTPISLPNATKFDRMFEQTALTEMPEIDVSRATSVEAMFKECVFMKSGIYAMYQRLAALPNITNHYLTFYKCGEFTVEGSAELAQIPSDWK